MKDQTWGAITIIGTILVLIIVAVFLSNFGVSDYKTVVGIEEVRQLLSKNRIGICSEKDFVLDKSPGFVAGKSLTLSLDCMTDPEELKVSVITYNSETARNTALRNVYSANRGGFGNNFAYIYGPNLITIQGDRDLAAQLVLGKILNRAGATP